MTTTSEPKVQTKARMTTGERWIIAGVIAAVAGASTFAVFDYVNNRDPEIRVPMPQMPDPNAFDAIVTASSTAVESYPMEGSTLPTPGSPVTSTVGRHSFKQPKRVGAPDFSDPAILAAAQAVFKKNTGLQASVESAFKDPYLTPPVRSFSQPLRYLTPIRRVGRALAFESQVDFARGNVDAGVTAAIDTIHLGALEPRGGTLIHKLVGNAVQSIGRRGVWSNIDKLDSAHAIRMARALEKDDSEGISTADVLKEEKLGGEAGLMEIFRSRDWQRTLQTAVYSGNTPSIPFGLGQPIIGKRTIMEQYIAAMDDQIAQVSRPYSPTWSTPPNMLPIVDSLVGEGHGFVYRCDYDQTENRLLMTVCALRAYRLDHGSYPSTLADLVPTYLRGMPVDPFSPGSPLAYRKTPKSFILYSIGPDIVDDGGKPATGKRSGDNPGGTEVQMDSKGDIVAGIDQ